MTLCLKVSLWVTSVKMHLIGHVASWLLLGWWNWCVTTRTSSRKVVVKWSRLQKFSKTRRKRQFHSCLTLYPRACSPAYRNQRYLMTTRTETFGVEFMTVNFSLGSMNMVVRKYPPSSSYDSQNWWIWSDWLNESCRSQSLTSARTLKKSAALI